MTGVLQKPQHPTPQSSTSPMEVTSSQRSLQLAPAVPQLSGFPGPAVPQQSGFLAPALSQPSNILALAAPQLSGFPSPAVPQLSGISAPATGCIAALRIPR